jgi:CRP/FNR family cyclic AMP-dependent transcriptional regulator
MALPALSPIFSARVVEPMRAFALDGQCLGAKGGEDHVLGYELLMRFARVIIQQLDATRLQLLDIYGVPALRSAHNI